MAKAVEGFDRATRQEMDYVIVPGSWNDFECLERLPPEEPEGSSSWIARVGLAEVAAAVGGVAALAVSLTPLL